MLIRQGGLRRLVIHPTTTHCRNIGVGLAAVPLVCIGLLTASAIAQQPDAGQAATDPLAGVRQRVAFTNADDGVIDGWLTGKLDQLKAADDQNFAELAAGFRAAIQSELTNTESSPRYLDRLAGRVGRLALAELVATGNDGPVDLSTTLAWILYDLSSVSTREALAAGLRHRRAPVRYLCAMTYHRLKPDIAADAATTRSVILRLKEAGVAETDGVVMGAIYQALAYGEPRHLPDALQALTEVLAARVQRRSGGQQLRADRAELLAFEYLNRIRGDIPQALRPPLVAQLAALLALDVRRYGAAVPDERRVIEERIEVGESLIEALSGAGGANVRAAVKKGGDAVEDEMALELLNWVGGEGVEGSLNKAPWNVPVGGLP